MGRGLECQPYSPMHTGESVPGRERQRKVGAELKERRGNLDEGVTEREMNS